MSSPQEIILAQMIALAEQIEGVGAAMPTDGREPEQMAAEAARRRAAGATVFCRVQNGTRNPLPVVAVRSELTILFAVACPSVEGRRSCLEGAYALWHLLFRAAENNDLGMSYIARNLRLSDWQLVYDSPQCAIVDMAYTMWVDLANIPDLPDGSPLPVPALNEHIQYSADGTAWHATYADGDIYARWSTDGGTTWGDALRFQGPPGSGADAEAIQGVPVSETAPTTGQVLAFDGEQYVPATPAAVPAAASEEEALAGTGTATRVWSPLRIWQAVAGYLASILTAANQVLYRSATGLAALTLRTEIRAAGVADDLSLPTEAAVRTQIDGRAALSVLTTAGDRYRATADGVVQRQPALVALGTAGAGSFAPALVGSAHHTVTRSGEWTGIAPTGLEDGEGCTVQITGAYNSATTGLQEDWDGMLAEISAASVLLVIRRSGSTYRATCKELA